MYKVCKFPLGVKLNVLIEFTTQFKYCKAVLKLTFRLVKLFSDQFKAVIAVKASIPVKLLIPNVFTSIPPVYEAAS